MAEAVSSNDDGSPRTVNVTIDDLSFATTTTGVRGRRRLQDVREFSRELLLLLLLAMWRGGVRGGILETPKT